MYLMVEIKTIFTQYWIHEAFVPKGKLPMNGIRKNCSYTLNIMPEWLSGRHGELNPSPQSLTVLSPNSDQRQISPCNINAL